MNYDLKTPDGMANAVTWINETLNMLKEGGTWVVPRSLSAVTVLSHEPKVCKVLSMLPDPSIRQVLRAAGWSVK